MRSKLMKENALGSPLEVRCSTKSSKMINFAHVIHKFRSGGSLKTVSMADSLRPLTVEPDVLIPI